MNNYQRDANEKTENVNDLALLSHTRDQARHSDSPKRCLASFTIVIAHVFLSLKDTNL